MSFFQFFSHFQPFYPIFRYKKMEKTFHIIPGPDTTSKAAHPSGRAAYIFNELGSHYFINQCAMRAEPRLPFTMRLKSRGITTR